MALTIGATPAWAASGGDANAGDVWLDNAGQPAGPGHEMDPHLGCADIVLYGAKLADSSGTFTIDGWPPSGSKSVDYSGTWAVQSGTQQIALIPINKLMAGAQASGDTPANQGYHFKLQFVQDPQKHKTFWVNCTSSPGGQSPGGGTSGGGKTPGGAPGGTTGGPTTGPSSGSSPSGSSSPTSGSTSPSTGSSSTVTAGATTRSAVKAAHKTRKKHHKKLARPRRHAPAKRRSVKAMTVIRSPSFTG